MSESADEILIAATNEIVAAGAFEFSGTVVPLQRDDGVWELMFVAEEHSEWE